MKTIFVIDSKAIALHLRSIPYYPDLILLDTSDNLEDALSLKSFCQMLWNGIDCDKIVAVSRVPSFWSVDKNGSFVNMVKTLFTFEVKIRISKFDLKRIISESFLIGPRTSALMLLVPSSFRILVDHGIGEFFDRRVDKNENKLKNFLSLLIYYFRRPVYSSNIFSAFEHKDYVTAAGVCVRCFSYDLSSFLGPKVLSKIYRLDMLRSFASTAVVLFGHTPHSGGLIDSHLTESDIEANSELVLDALAESESVICKFHPSIADTADYFEKILQKLQDVDTRRIILYENLLIKNEEQMPVELIFFAFEVSGLYCSNSAVAFTLRTLSFDRFFYIKKFVFASPDDLQAKLSLLADDLKVGVSFR